MTVHSMAGRVLDSSFARQPGAPTSSARWAGLAVAVAALTGAGVAYGKAAGYAVVAMVALGAAIVVVGRIGLPALLFWAATDEVLAPFIRFPTVKAIVTFDRVWLIACLGALIFTHRQVPISRPVRRLILAFVAFGAVYGLNALVTFLRSGDITAPTIFVDTYGLALATFLVTVWLVKDRSDLRMVIIALTIGAVVNSCIGIAEQLLNFSFAANYNTVAPRVFSTSVLFVSGGFEAPEAFAVSLLVAEAGSLYLFQTGKGRARLLTGLATLLIAAGIAMTIFRSAWAAEVIVALIAFGFRPKQHGRFFWVLVATAGLAIVIALFFTQSSSVNPVTGAAAFQRHTFSSEDLYSRLATYEQGLSLFLAHPLLGVGVQQYLPAAIQAPLVVIEGHTSVPEAHDSFIGVLAEQGIVGIVLFVFLIACFVRMLSAAFRAARDDDDQALVASGIGAGIAYLLMSVGFQVLPMAPSNDFVALLMGLVAARLDWLRAQGSDRASGGAGGRRDARP